VRARALPALAASTLALATGAGAAVAEAPPVGPLPSGPTATIQTRAGQLVAVALPHRANGRVWRIARRFDARILAQVSEADVGANVVLVFRARRPGAVTVAFGLTRGERSKAYESRRFVVRVR
jgi:hypothetical protein